MSGVPIISVAIVAILLVVLVGVLVASIVWRRRKEGNSEQPIYMNRRAFSAQFAVGLLVALLGAFFMWHGSILGEDTISIARILGIVGICLIATSAVTGRAIKP